MEQKQHEVEPKDAYDEEKWVYDSSVDSKGRVPLRAATGVWKASLFVIGIEFSERLSYFGIATSLVIYLTRVLKEDVTMAVKNVNYWVGVTTLMPLLGGFLADSYLGRYSTVLASSIIYLMGLVLLTLSWIIPSLKACETDVCTQPRKIHELVFFVAIYLISIGTGGHKPSLESFGADQFDDDHAEERTKKMSYFNWWNFGLCAGVLLAVTLIVYVQDHVGWGASGVILTSVMALSLIVFIIGRPFYRYRVPSGSPLTPMLQVLSAAIAKRNLPYPSGACQLHEVDKPQHANGRLLCHTKNLKFLDKAAIVEDTSSMEKQSPWRLATVTKVEEMKLIINMIPIWFSSLAFGICAAQTSTFFIKQSSEMNRTLGKFEIPSATVFSISAISMIISVVIYEKLLIPFLRRTTGNERGISILQRIGVGNIFSIFAMIAAALVEKRRLEASAAISVFWLAPQYIIMGVADAFGLVGLQEYFYDQVPDSMRSLGIAFYLSVIGAANFASSLLITFVARVTAEGGKSWFGKTLNSSRLDKFYWLVAGITTANLFMYVVLAKRYSYKNVQRNVPLADSCNGDIEAVPMA